MGSGFWVSGFMYMLTFTLLQRKKFDSDFLEAALLIPMKCC